MPNKRFNAEIKALRDRVADPLDTVDVSDLKATINAHGVGLPAGETQRKNQLAALEGDLSHAEAHLNDVYGNELLPGTIEHQRSVALEILDRIEALERER